jgi:enamine deaminase RidA (YjgF/YER057c/UK114 family)
MIIQKLFTSPVNASFIDKINSCIDFLEESCQIDNVAGAVIFINSFSDTDYFNKKDLINQVISDRNLYLPVNVQSQSFSEEVSIEIWICRETCKIEYLSIDNFYYTKIETLSTNLIFGFGLSSELQDITTENQIDFAFEKTLEILKAENLDFSNVIRQWNYVPDITGFVQKNDKKLQKYQLFNEIRQKYYSACNFDKGYPAATGIGTGYGNFCIDFIAFDTNKPLVIKSISNPKQSDAYKYSQEKLVGDKIDGNIKKAPLFERAKIIKNEDFNVTFISGTASIIGEETIGINDIVLQTETTIDNISGLTPGLIQQKNINYSYVRAYIKEEKDLDAVKSICDEKFPGVKTVYLKSDICRNELLVEIETAISL